MNKKINISEKLRKKHGACEHNQVSYLALEKLLDIYLKRSKEDAKIIKDLGLDLRAAEHFAAYQEVIIRNYYKRIHRLEKINKKLVIKINESPAFEEIYDKYTKLKKDN